MKWTTCFLLLAALSLSACRFGLGKKVKGNGHTVTSSRNPGSFYKLVQKGSFDLVLRTGATHEVLIEAEENIIPYIESYVDGQELVIQSKEGFWLRPSRSVHITVTAPSLKEVWSNGSGNITGENLISDSVSFTAGTRGSGDLSLQVQSPEVKAYTYGSGNITLSGDTRSVILESAGSGDLKADKLRSETTSIEIKGSGNASVNASKSVDIKVRGSGDVSYKGNPSVRSDIKGSGSVYKID